RISARYRDSLDARSGLRMPFHDNGRDRTSSHHLAVVILPEDAERDDVRAALAAEGIQTSVHYPPIHTFSAYRETRRRELPGTDAVADHLLPLPLYGRMTDTQVDAVIEALLGCRIR